jgi:pilus assembly protein Flp/PilA
MLSIYWDYVNARYLGQKGQGMVEYAVILTMVVVVAAAFTGGGDLTKSIQDTLKDAANVIKPAATPGA